MNTSLLRDVIYYKNSYLESGIHSANYLTFIVHLLKVGTVLGRLSDRIQY